MAFKLVALMCMVSVARAGLAPAPLTYAAPAPILHAAPLTYAAPAAPLTKLAVEQYDPHPQYSYAYDVQDGLTGDSKTQHETRDGDVVRGSYSVVDPDGIKRTVDYTADPQNGFNAVVHREPVGLKVAKVAAPVTYAAAPVVHVAPVVHHAAAPVAYSAAPLVHSAPAVHHAAAPVAYAAPVAKFAAPVAYAASPVYHH